ncbi:MAG TPA: heavy metal sensor histidine kinase [Woeseiaceae bacterium]|nr:heavy metal sensor histidine kinase [Woeseiaceae bacterium]
MRWSSRDARRPLSLSTRVMLFVALAIGLSLLMIGHLVQNAVERHFAEQDAGELVVITKAVERALRDAADDITPLTEALSHAVSGHHGVYFQVWDLGGQLIYGPDETELSQQVNNFAPVSRIQAANLYAWQAGGKTYRGTVMQILIGGQGYRIVSAIDMNFHIHFLDNFRRSLWLIMILAGIVTLLAAWYGVHQGHAPLRGLSDTMRDVQADRLHVRLDPDAVPGELRTLVNSFNHMIGRLEDSFARLSHFSADIAHELRTPLTNLITQTQVSLGKPRSLDQYRELLYSNLEEQERLAKMVNDMLWLAQSEHGLLRPVQVPLDLGQEVRELFDYFEALAEERQIELVLQGIAPRIHGDRAMLRRALSNLLSNAIRHTPAQKSVLIRLDESSDGSTVLSVQNPGSEIPAKHLPRLFERFYRVDPSRARQSEGAGLGLAIVKSIVEAHGGKIEASSGKGVTTFTLSFKDSRV